MIFEGIRTLSNSNLREHTRAKLGSVVATSFKPLQKKEAKCLLVNIQNLIENNDLINF